MIKLVLQVWLECSAILWGLGSPKTPKEILRDDSFYAHFSLSFRPKIQRIFKIYKGKKIPTRFSKILLINFCLAKYMCIMLYILYIIYIKNFTHQHLLKLYEISSNWQIVRQNKRRTFLFGFRIKQVVIVYSWSDITVHNTVWKSYTNNEYVLYQDRCILYSLEEIRKEENMKFFKINWIIA